MNILYRRAKLSEAVRVAVVREYNAGLSINSIVEHYNIARSTLYKVLREMAQRPARTRERGREEVKDEKH